MNIVVVLHNSKNVINIASVIRAMKNFGLQEIRLVTPREWDPHRAEGIAHGTRDLIDRVEICETLEQALADCVHVAAMTARHRTAKRNVQRADEAAAEIVELQDQGRVALLLGPEDTGLTNSELDMGTRIVTIDTSDEHPSLNLAQAFAVMSYELFKAAGNRRSFKPPKREAEPATQEDLGRLFSDVENTLQRIEFFKSRNSEHIMRTVREVTHRVPLDIREAALLRAMALEVGHYLDRNGDGRGERD